MTKAGGLDLPGEMAGVIALDEIVVHGWDVARSSGQPYDVRSARGRVRLRRAARRPRVL
jgi:hypothetical protein